LNLRRDQVKHLKTLSNASEFVRNAIDKVISKKPKESELKPQVKKEFSAIEKRLIKWLIDMKDRFYHSCSTAGYREFGKPFRYITKPNWPEKNELLTSLTKDMKSKEYNEYVKTCSKEELQEVFDEATRRWLANYPEHWLKHITPKWTLGDIMFELKGWDQMEVTMHEVAAIMGVNYQAVFNKIRPLLEAEGVTFVRKQMEHRKLIQAFDLNYLKKLGLEEKRLKRYSEDFDKLAWELSQQGSNATKIARLLGVYPAFVRKRIVAFRKKQSKR